MSSRFDLRGLRDRGELGALGKELGAELKTDDVASLAAAVSFKIVLALFPALLAAVAIYALVADPRDIADLAGNLPEDVTQAVSGQLDEFIRQAASGGVAFVGIVAGLWSASSAAVTLNRALSRAYDESDDRKLVAARAAALGVTVALLLALIAISVLLVAGGSIENAVLETLPLADAARSIADFGSTVGRYLSAVLLLMVLFAFIYWIGPDFERRPGWVWITPGAAVAVVTWLLASALFGWYVANFGSYTKADSPYGPLGSAIVFMLWLQLSMFALLLGAEVNQVLALRVRRGSADGLHPGAGSIGTADDAETAGAPVAAAGAAGPAGGRVRAATVPTGRGARRSAAGRITLDADEDRTAATGPGSTASRATPGRSVAVRAHGRDAGTAARRAGGADGAGVPTATKIGAGVAVLSGLVGLTGLLRRLKG